MYVGLQATTQLITAAPNMNVKPGHEQIQILMQQARDKYEFETATKLNVNWITDNYNGLTQKLNEISHRLPTSHPKEFKSISKNGNNAAFQITNTQVRDAYMRKVNNLKPYFLAALNIYLFGSISPERDNILTGANSEEGTDEFNQGDVMDQAMPVKPLEMVLDETYAEEDKEGKAESNSRPNTTSHEKNIFNEMVGIIALIAAGVIALLLLLLTVILKTSPLVRSQLTEAFNIIVLFCFFIVLKKRKLEFESESDVRTLATTLNLSDRDTPTMRFNIDRVNKIISQLCDKTRWFIIFLLLFYFLNLIEDINPNDFLHRYVNGVLIMDFLENVCNAISAAFLYFGFKILYEKTLDEKNNNKDYYMGTLLFLLIFICSYFVLLLVYSESDLQDKISNYYNLVCGIYNGWAMGLLFGRLISMEYFFKDIQLSSYRFSKLFFHYGAIFVLPIYVLANCLYGVQEFTEFNGEIAGLKWIIFLICFIGKGFFLLFLFHYINFRWLHIYIHIILANNSIPRNLVRLINRSANK